MNNPQPSLEQMKLALNNLRMYSPLEKAAMAVARTKGTPSEFMAEASKQPGFKPEEVADRKIGMPGVKMTKPEFLAHVQSHPAPRLKEIVLGGKDYEEALDQKAQEIIGDEYATFGDLYGRDSDMAKASVEADFGYNPETKHEEWQLPGGDNYREVLLKLPKKGLTDNERKSLMIYEADLRRGTELRPDHQKQYEALKARENDDSQDFYHRGHWDDPNVVAHLRLSDRTGPNKEKILHIEEVQSDWHQAGRKDGYRVPGETYTLEENRRMVDEIMERFNSGEIPVTKRNELLDKLYEAGENKNKVPEAPFKKSWHELALKHALGMAAKGGYHGIAITPGDVQAERWENPGLKVQYDKTIPAFLNKLGKPHGTQVGTISINTPKANEPASNGEIAEGLGMSWEDLAAHPDRAQLEKQFWDARRNQSTDMHYFPIADSLRQQIKTEGLPQYRTGGIAHMAEGGSMTTLEQMKAQLMANKPPIALSQLQSIGAKEAPGMRVKSYVPQTSGGDDTVLPVGGIDMSASQPGHQLALPTKAEPQQMPGQPPQGMPGAPGQPPMGALPGPAPAPRPPGSSNILQMTPQGQAMSAMRPPAAMADGGGVSGSGSLNLTVPMSVGGGGGGGGGMGQMPGLGRASQPSLGDMMNDGGVSPMLPRPLQQPQMGQMDQGTGGGQVDQQNMLNQMLKAFSEAQKQNAGPDLLAQSAPMGQTRPANPFIAGMADGGSMSDKSTEDMKAELDSKSEEDDEEAKAPATRLTIKADGPGGVKGIVVPHHMLHGRSWVSKKTGKTVVVPGMNDINKARAQVYGSENRDPLNIGQVGRIHKEALEEHFKKPLKEQLAAEQAATTKLRAAKHLGDKANTLDKSEKLDTVNHEHDDQGRTYIGFASKGVAGHALYTSGHGDNMKHHVLNTCPGQTAGCGGGTDKDGIVDTSKGTCFAPNAESQYVHAAVRRATHEQAKHDPAMTKDWILAHAGSLRQAAKTGDKKNKVLLFRPNVVDETDVSSRHVIRHLNEQRKEEGKPGIVANSYGKTTELHDPENGYYVTHSNVGPKTKKGASVSENIDRDQQRVRQTILGTKNKKGDDLVNEQGNKTPPKNSYMVTDVKRNSPFDKKMQDSITHAKYWSTGRAEHELSDDEKDEGEEGHYGPSGRKTTPDKAHFGHETHDGLRYDYQKQHILHPRLVQVGKNKDGTPHMIPTDSRFKDEEFLPKKRFMTKTGKTAGAILMTTPTESTSNLGHETSFTHHVNESHIEHAKKNNGEYVIDHPKDQIKSAGKEYSPPQPIKFMASGGSVAHEHEDFDGHMAFPEQSFGAQHRLTYRHDPEEAKEIGDLPYHAGARNINLAFGQYNHRPKVSVHKDLDTMALELTRKMKAK